MSIIKSTKKILRYFVMGLGIVLINGACVKDSNFELPDTRNSDVIQPNSTFEMIMTLYQGEVLQIRDELIIEGFVVSSDKAGNFFNILHIQNSKDNPSQGFQLEIDLRDSHVFYPAGCRVFLNVKGLYLGKRDDSFRIGGALSIFGNLTVGRLPALQLREHLIKADETIFDIRPKKQKLDELTDNAINTLIKLDSLEVVAESLGLTYANLRESTAREVQDCNGNLLKLRNSGFSDFQAELLPLGNGTINGVLLKDNGTFELAIRELSDVDLSNKRCEEVITEFSSNAIFISELADPNNDADARFVELYNAGSEAIALKGWQLLRYTNANTEVSASLDLSDYQIDAQKTLLISSKPESFEKVYGLIPDITAPSNGVADSNGDDNLVLIDPFGVVIDAFGVIGEDGCGTDHEFEDGRALRKPNITIGNPNFTPTEWTIYNDSGRENTINMPQDAPQNFSPGIRN